ncbi:bifunctional oligoribonuclease/PAP phosphatase NrnA [soil metagenome]
MMNRTGQLEVPESRREDLLVVARRLSAARHVVLTTHVGADGDGTGSQVAVASWLESRGVGVTIVNPTPFPAALRFLVPHEGMVAELGEAGADTALQEMDLALVLDTSEANRVAPLMKWLDPSRTIVVDHHPPGPTVVADFRVQDTSAAATGELVYDLVEVAGGQWNDTMALGVYVAIVSDTGSFRFSNTTPRAHAVAARMLELGVDPEYVFRQLFGTAPRRRVELLREALATLDVDEELGVTWMMVPHETGARLQVTGDDYEGIIEHARSLEGTRIALLLREMAPGETKVSFRSSGDADVNRIARTFGGGGHAKAAGAAVHASPQEALRRILAEIRKQEMA